MRVTDPRYIFLGDDGEELPPGEQGYAALAMNVDGVPVMITIDNCKFVGYGYRLVSLPELTDSLLPIDFPRDERTGIDPQHLRGVTDDPVIYALTRDFYESVMRMGIDPEAFEVGPAPSLPESLLKLNR